MKLRVKKQADKEYKTGDVIEFEHEVSQEEIDGIVRERIGRLKQGHVDELAEVKKETDSLKAKLAELQSKTGDVEKIRTEYEERIKTVSKAADEKVSLADKKLLVSSEVVASGIQLPQVYLDAIKVEAGDSEEKVKEKVKASIEQYKKDFKTTGRQAVGNPDNGGGEGDVGFTDAELLVMAKKEFPTLVRNSKDDSDILRQMKAKAKRGELKKAA